MVRQVTAASSGSSTTTPVSVTLPVFVTTNVYRRVEPAVFPVGVPACLSKETLGADAIVVSVESVAVTGSPAGGVAETVAVLTT